MAQDLTVNIKTTSDVPQAMDKAKTATVSFSKQVEDIQKKFSTGFKDIFIGFFAPMVLLNAAISYFGNKIAEAQKLAADGFDKLADSSTRYGTAEEKTLAAQLKLKMDLIKAEKELRAGKTEMFKTYLETTPEGKALVEREISKGGTGFQMGMNIPFMREKFVSGLAMMNQIQAEILDIEDRKISPEQRKLREREMEAASLAEFEASKVKADKKETNTMSSGAVSGNVIGVGSNPVLSAIHEQVELAKQQLEYLRMIAAKGDKAGPPPDLTEKGATPSTPSSPSRASLLIPKK
jgi:hypothetical protein